jgi:hypothetical protein
MLLQQNYWENASTNRDARGRLPSKPQGNIQTLAKVLGKLPITEHLEKHQRFFGVGRMM